MLADDVALLWLQAMAFDGGSKEERITSYQGDVQTIGTRSTPTSAAILTWYHPYSRRNQIASSRQGYT